MWTDYMSCLVTQPYVHMSVVRTCCVPCPVPRTPVFSIKYDSTVTLSRQVESPVHLARTISSISHTLSQKVADKSLVTITPSLYVIVA
jgi:hypothetical protein